MSLLQDALSLIQALETSFANLTLTASEAEVAQGVLINTLVQTNVTTCLADGRGFLPVNATLQQLLGWDATTDARVWNVTEYLVRTLTDLSDFSESRLNEWQSIVLFVSYILIPCLLVFGVLVAGFEAIQINRRLQPILVWIIVPIFGLQSFAAYTTGAGMLIATTMNAGERRKKNSFLSCV